jgi:protein-S-isoprenylcysteine O-methyltransferase Ste14
MRLSGWLILACWVVLVAVWVVSGPRAKRSTRRGWVWWCEIALRLPILIIVLLALRLGRGNHAGRIARLYAITRSPVAGVIGVALCAVGVGLAVLARIYLGRNWGLPMSRKEAPELVTTGPYAAVRHPIYAGILLATIGSAIGQSIFWALGFVVLAPYFIYSARREEELMLEQFPDQYPAYMRRTRMLLPRIRSARQPLR